MAYTDLTTDFLRLWVQHDPEHLVMQKQFVMGGVDTVQAQKSDVFARFEKGDDCDSPTVWWPERRGIDFQLTGQLTTASIVVSGSLLKAAATAASLKQHVRVDTILERQSDGLQVIVTACDYPNLTLTVAAHGNTGSLPSNDGGAVTWEIIAETSSDYNETHQPKSTGAVMRFVGTQIHEEVFEYPDSWEHTAFEKIKNNVRDQLDIIVKGMRAKIARSAIRMAPVYASSAYVTGSSTQNPAMTGLCQWPRILQAESANTGVYVNKSSAELALDDLDNLVYSMETDERADFSVGRWGLAFHPYQHRFIEELLRTYRRLDQASNIIGFAAGTYMSKQGKDFVMVPDWNMPKGMIMVVDFAACKWGFYSGDDIHVKDLATQGRTNRKLVSCQTYGTVIGDPRGSMGTIYGLPIS